MKNLFKMLMWVAFFVCLTIAAGCKKDTEKSFFNLTTNGAYMITPSSAVLSNNISASGGSEIVSRGVCWNTNQEPTIDDFKTSDGNGTGPFVSKLNGLTANTVYYLRVYAVTGSGAKYSPQISFKTEPAATSPVFNTDLSYGSVTDVDGNTYKTIQIGNRTWMAENLRTTHYNDGQEIPMVEENIDWRNSYTASYCWYYLDSADYKETFGALYNWYTISSQKICPSGWHIPEYADFNSFIEFLGQDTFSVSKLLETGNAHWKNINGTNESGWTALPGGMRTGEGVFTALGSEGGWWISPDDIYAESGVSFIINDTSDQGYGSDYNDDVTLGRSIRCIKD